MELVLAIAGALGVLGGTALALSPKLDQMMENPNTPGKMAARAAEWRNKEAARIQGEHASMRAPHKGETFWKADAGHNININVHGVTDPEKVGAIVKREVASLMGTLGSDLVNPKSGNFHTFTPNLAHGYA
jgi:hypothetical protein